MVLKDKYWLSLSMSFPPSPHEALLLLFPTHKTLHVKSVPLKNIAQGVAVTRDFKYEKGDNVTKF